MEMQDFRTKVKRFSLDMIPDRVLHPDLFRCKILWVYLILTYRMDYSRS